MDDYLNLFREMISLRSLTEHTAKSYSTYIKTYLFYLSEILHKTPEEVSWSDLREFVRWLQREKSLSDRTINHLHERTLLSVNLFGKQPNRDEAKRNRDGL